MRIAFAIIYFLTLQAAAAPPPYCPTGDIDADATTRYLNLLSHLVGERKLAAEVADALGGRDTEMNPLDLGSLPELAAYPYRAAFGKLLAEGVDWARVREGAKRIAASGHAGEEKRNRVGREIGLPLAALKISDLYKTAGLAVPPDPPAMITRIAADGTGYAIELPRDGGHAPIAFRFDRNGDVKATLLPVGASDVRFVGERGAACVVKSGKGATVSVVDIESGAETAKVKLDFVPTESTPIFVRDGKYLGLVGPGRLTLVPFDGSPPIVRELPPNDRHVVSENGAAVISYALEQGRLTVRNAETGHVFVDTPFARSPLGSVENMVRAWPGKDGTRPFLILRREGGGTVVVDGTSVRDIDVGNANLFKSRFLASPDGKLYWVAQSTDGRTGECAIHVVDRDRPSELRMPLRKHTLDDAQVIVSTEGRPLIVHHWMDFVGAAGKRDYVLVSDLAAGVQTKLDLTAFGVHLFKGLTLGENGAVIGIFGWPGGRGVGRSVVQLYGPKP